MAGGYITISRRKYAAGLFWQPAPLRGNMRERAAKISHATKMHASLFVAFNGMIGLSSRRSGAYQNMPIAASEVIEAFSENTFLSVFSVPEGYWLLAVRGGIIIRDVVFRDIASAQKEYAELNVMPDWAVLVAPSDWRAPSAVERHLADLVSGNRKYKLSNISHLPGYFMTIVILFTAAFIGYDFFKEPIEKMVAPSTSHLKVDSVVMEEYKEKKAKIEAPVPVPKRIIHVKMPYENISDVSEKAEQCFRAIAFLSQPIVGWNLDSAVCIDGEASAHLLRDHGTISDLYDEVAKKMIGTRVDETGGDDVILTAKLKSIATKTKVPKYSADDIMPAVQSVFQRINENVDFRKEYINLDIPELGENEVLDTDKRDVPVVRIQDTTKLEPKEFVKILDGVDSAQISVIKWDNKSRNWNYEVDIFVK